MSFTKEDAPSIKVIISGISGSGKSTLFEKLIRREKAKWIFLFDKKKGDFARRFKTRPCYTYEELIEATARGGFIIYDYRKEFPGEPEKGLLFFADFVFKVSEKLKGKKIFGSDEFDELTSTQSDPVELCELLQEGRVFEIRCYFICHAMNAIHNRVKNQLTEIFAFKQGGETAAKWLVKEKDFSQDELFQLGYGEFLYKNTLTGDTARGGKKFTPKDAGRDLKNL